MTDDSNQAPSTSNMHLQAYQSESRCSLVWLAMCIQQTSALKMSYPAAFAATSRNGRVSSLQLYRHRQGWSGMALDTSAVS